MTITKDTLLEINGEQIKIGAWLKQFAKKKKYKPFNTGKGELSPNELAVLLFDYAVSGDSPDDALGDFIEDIAEIAATVLDFATTPKSNADLKAERDQAKANAEAEEKEKLAAAQAEQLAVVNAFNDSVGNGSAATTGVTTALFAGIRDAFPDSVKVLENGTVELNNATVEDIGFAFGAAVQLDKTTQFASNMLGFIVGELTNAAVLHGVYANKKECATAMSSMLEEKKIKSLSHKTIENFARVAERIPADKRNEAVAPTIYHEIANVKQLKPSEGESNAAFTKRKTKRDKQVTAILDKVNSGEVSSVKDVKKLISNLQVESGSKEANTYSYGDYVKLLIEAITLPKFIGKEGSIVGIKGSENSTEITREDLKEVSTSALAHIQNILNIDPKKEIEISDLLYRYMESSKAPVTQEA